MTGRDRPIRESAAMTASDNEAIAEAKNPSPPPPMTASKPGRRQRPRFPLFSNLFSRRADAGHHAVPQDSSTATWDTALELESGGAEAIDMRGPIIIHASLMRSGTLSLARAYSILGFRSHHIMDDMPLSGYADLELAAEATWPTAPGVRHPAPRPYTRRDWDELFGGYDVVTDAASFFAPQMVDAYPGARVVVVQRDFEPWWESFRERVVEQVFVTGPRAWLVPLSTRLAGFRGIQAMQKMVLGAFGAGGPEDVNKERARRVWEAYYAEVRAKVPPHRRLEYRLGDGWEPLCAFLGCPVPDEPFPRVNDRESHSKSAQGYFDEVMGLVWAEIRLYVYVGLFILALFVVLTVVSKGGLQETIALVGTDVAAQVAWKVRRAAGSAM